MHQRRNIVKPKTDCSELQETRERKSLHAYKLKSLQEKVEILEAHEKELLGWRDGSVV